MNPLQRVLGAFSIWLVYVSERTLPQPISLFAGFSYERSTGALEFNPRARVASQSMWSLGATENNIMREVLGK
jgi:hypothetical protein